MRNAWGQGAAGQQGQPHLDRLQGDACLLCCLMLLLLPLLLRGHSPGKMDIQVHLPACFLSFLFLSCPHLLLLLLFQHTAT